MSKTNPPQKPPEVYHLDPPAGPPSWATELRDMMSVGQKELMSELQNHKTHLSQVVSQVQGIDRKQEALTKAQGDMATRLDNMEAEVRNLRSRSRSVSPAPNRLPPPSHSPRSTTASTLGKPVVDDFQLVIGGWDEARRTDIEQEIRYLFDQIGARALLHNIHIPFVPSRFARIELLYVSGSLSDRRKVQTLTLQALKSHLEGYTSTISGQERRRLWATRNRSREDREKIRALVSIKDWASKHLSTQFIDLDWSGRLWIRSEQVLYWHQFRKPDEDSMMLTNAAGDETGWFVDVRQLGRLLSLNPEQVRDELLN